jgi:ribonuclease D
MKHETTSIIWVDKASDIPTLLKAIEGEPQLALDTEFIREKTYFPKLELLQIATSSSIFLIDAAAFKGSHPPQDPTAYDASLTPVLDFLKDPSILKVAHAASQDQEALLTSFGISVQPLFDTAVAASLIGYREQMGLASLLECILNVHLPKGLARVHWNKRPLSTSLLEYAASDVRHLLKLANVLMKKLRKVDRLEWALERSQVLNEPMTSTRFLADWRAKLLQDHRLHATSKAKAFALLRWREKKAQALNRPRRWILEDSLILDLARMSPNTPDDLKQLRSLSATQVKQYGSSLIEALHHLDPSFENAQKRKKVPHLSENKQHCVAFLKCILNLECQNLGLRPSIILSNEALLAFVTQPAEAIQFESGTTPPVTKKLDEILRGALQGKYQLRIQDECLALYQSEADLKSLSQNPQND